MFLIVLLISTFYATHTHTHTHVQSHTHDRTHRHTHAHTTKHAHSHSNLHMMYIRSNFLYLCINDMATQKNVCVCVLCLRMCMCLRTQVRERVCMQVSANVQIFHIQACILTFVCVSTKNETNFMCLIDPYVSIYNIRSILLT